MHEVFLNGKHLTDLIDFIGMRFVANQCAFVEFICQNPFDSRTRPQKAVRNFRRVAHGFLFHLLVLIVKRRFHSLGIELMCDIFQPIALQIEVINPSNNLRFFLNDYIFFCFRCFTLKLYIYRYLKSSNNRHKTTKVPEVLPFCCSSDSISEQTQTKKTTHPPESEMVTGGCFTKHLFFVVEIYHFFNFFNGHTGFFCNLFRFKSGFNHLHNDVIVFYAFCKNDSVICLTIQLNGSRHDLVDFLFGCSDLR